MASKELNDSVKKYYEEIKIISEQVAYYLYKTTNHLKQNLLHWAEIGNEDNRFNIYPLTFDESKTCDLALNNDEKVQMDVQYYLNQATFEPWKTILDNLKTPIIENLKTEFLGVQGNEETLYFLSECENLLVKNNVNLVFNQENKLPEFNPKSEDYLSAVYVMNSLNVNQGAGDFDAFYLYGLIGCELYNVPSFDDIKNIEHYLMVNHQSKFDKKKLLELYALIPQEYKPIVYAFSYQMAQSKFNLILKETVFPSVTVHDSFFVTQSTPEDMLWYYFSKKFKEKSEIQLERSFEEFFSDYEFLALWLKWNQEGLKPELTKLSYSMEYADKALMVEGFKTLLNQCLRNQEFYKDNQAYFDQRINESDLNGSAKKSQITNFIAKYDELDSTEVASFNLLLLTLFDPQFDYSLQQKKVLVDELDAHLERQFRFEADSQYVLDPASKLLVKIVLNKIRDIYKENSNNDASHTRAELEFLDTVDATLIQEQNKVGGYNSGLFSKFNPNRIMTDVEKIRSLNLLYSQDHYKFIFGSSSSNDLVSAGYVLSIINQFLIDEIMPDEFEHKIDQCDANHLNALKQILDKFEAHYLEQTAPIFDKDSINILYLKSVYILSVLQTTIQQMEQL